MDYDYSTGMPLTSNVLPTQSNAGQYLTTNSNIVMWSTPAYVDDHLTYSGGVPVYQQHQLRQQHPALQEAWEAYLVLLHMCNDKS